MIQVYGKEKLVKKSKGEKIFNIFNVMFMIFLIFITIYPLIYVILSSVSDPKMLLRHEGLIFKPLGKASLQGYKMVFRNPNVLTGYVNTIFYVTIGTVINLILTTLGAFVLSRRNFYIKKIMMIMIVITMFFNGGLIPFFMVVRNLGLYNSRVALIIVAGINSFNLIIMRTFLQSIPYSLEEAAMIEGANDYFILIRVILPLSKPVLAVMVLYYGVHHWNSWFHAYIFIRDRALYPLQLILREILIESQTDGMIDGATEMLEESYFKELIKYCTIIISTLPILSIYPFLQKYFVKGVMIGSLKG